MKFSKALSIAALSIALAACSSGPSDSDVQAIATQQFRQLDQQLAPLGLKWTDVFDSEVKVKNKAKQDDGRWLVETEVTVTAKKDSKDLPQDAQFALMGLVGGALTKGQVMGGGPITGKTYMQKGDNGWIAQ